MSEKGNGHDPIAVEMVSVLKEIRAELGTLNGRVDTMAKDMGADLASLRTELTSLRSEMRVELAMVRDEVHELRLEFREDLGARVRKLEDAVFKRTG